MNCVSSCRGPCPCTFCEAKLSELNPFKKHKKRPVRRTLSRIRLLAHTECGICPGCKMEIVSTQAEVKDAKKQVVLAEGGDVVPPEGQWSAYLKSLDMSWLEAHFGIVYGRHPLLRVEVAKWYACLLHFNLRLTGGCINKLVFAYLGKFGKLEDQVAAIGELLKDCGIWVREASLKPKSKNQEAAYVPDISFVGKDAIGIHKLAEQLSDIVFPPAKRARDKDLQKTYDKAMKVWNLWRDIWRMINNAVDSDDEAARNKRADEVQVLGDEFRVAWYKAVGNTHGLYVHYLHEHLADQIRAVGDLSPYQAQGLEHLHSFRKLIARHLTNRQIVLSRYKRNRLTQSMGVQLVSKPRLQAHGTSKRHRARPA
jgi:hypothetical protein